MKKRLTAALLCLCLLFTMLPTTAFAAVGELLGNSRIKNQALLEELESLTGQDSEAIQALLEQYGLLDENGNLVTNKTVELDGVEYTLAEIEALLDDPDTKLAQIGYVDGVPIALGDLKTIIAIEKEFTRIQETYFSGKLFEGEALDNLNDLMAQIQNEGVSANLDSLSSTAVVNMSGFDAVAAGGSVKASFQAEEGVTYSVNISFDAGLAGLDSVTVSLGSNSQSLNSGNPTAALTYTASASGSVELKVEAGSGADAPTYAYGELAGAVQFSSAKGFVFQNGGIYSDSHTIRLTTDVAVPDLSTKWEQGYWEGPESADFTKPVGERPKSPDVYFEFLTDADKSSNQVLGISHDTSDANRETINEFIQFLQGAKGFTDASQVQNNADAVQFKLTVGSLSAYCAYLIRAEAWDYSNGPNMFFLPESGTGVDRVDLHSPGYGLYLTLANGNSHPSKFTNISTVQGRATPLEFHGSTKLGTEAIPKRLEIRGGIFSGSGDSGLSEYNYGILRNTAVELLNDESLPQLTSITAPAATYRPGQLVPVVLTFNELVYVNDTASITVGGDEVSGKTFTAEELHMSKAGNKIILWYPVQKVDNAQVTITSLTGITDIFGNAAEINGVTAEGAALESALLRDAPVSVSASYKGGEAVVTVSLSDETAYKQKYSAYHHPAGDEMQEVPYKAVVTNSAGQVIATEQVYVNEDGKTFDTKPFPVKAGEKEETYTVTLQVNEGTREAPNWMDLSYNANLKATFSVEALVPAAAVTIQQEMNSYVLSLAGEYRPTLTAWVYGPSNGTSFPPSATYQSGTWSSSDDAIATVTTEEDYSGKVVLTGKKVGKVTFTFTADNGTPDDETDDKTGVTKAYTVEAGDSLALVIPEGASTIVARQNAAATVLWNSNAAFFVPDKDFQYAIEVFKGNHTIEATLTDEPVYETTAAKDQNSIRIPENVLSELSSGDTPAYTVRVSMPHPNGSDESVRLSALAWIVVRPEPVEAVLTRPESIYLTDDKSSVDIQWSLKNWNESVGQTATLTILRVTEDDTSQQVYSETLSGDSGTCSLSLSKVADGYLKDTYQIMLSVENPGAESNSTDSFPLYVYNADALKIVNSEDQPITELTLDNTSKVDGSAEELPTDTAEILAMRQELGLLDYIGINYSDYSWNSFKDGIAWATDNDDISVNYKQGGLYEDIKLFDFDSYLPDLKMGVATVKDGTATITATHAATGISTSIPVTAHTLRDQFYLFQVTPAAETILRYTNGEGEERSVTTNSEGVLALYEPSGIASDVWLSSKSGDAEYLGTIYNYDLQSGEGDARKLQLYPLNTFRLREAAKAELTLAKPDGTPYTGTVTVRGGVYKNGAFCETAGLGTTRQNIGAAGAAQQDTTFTADANGKITVYFDFTQFWSAEAGEDEDDLPTAVDKIQYVLEIRDIDGNAYYPLFQMVDGTVSPTQVMRTASDVVVLEKVPQGENNKPFVARQVVDYHLNDGSLIDTRHSTGLVGPNYNFKEAVLTTNMLLWGESGDSASYTLTMADENGYVPKAQVSTGADRYPFTSMPVVENTMTLNEETMTKSGWIAEGKDMGIKTRLTQNGSMLQERMMPFRAIDLSQVLPVEEDENVTGMVLTLTESSGWQDSINFGNGGSSIFNVLLGDLGELTGPVDTSVFKMLITPSEDPSVFNALIWAGYDSLDLKDVEYKDGVAVSANLLTKGLEIDMPSVGDLQAMANGTYDPMGAYNPSRSNRLSDVAGFDFGVQMEGYYEAEIRYSRDSGRWEVYTKGGGFTAGVGIGFGFDVNTFAGPVPVTGSFEVGGAMQLSLQAATRYSQQDGLTWNDPSATAVTDFLTNLRLRAYVEAFGGIGFDYSLIALKIGLFGKLDVNSENSFLSREYLSDEGKRQLNGQYLDIQSEVGIKFEAVFTVITYEKVLVSGSFGYGKSFNDWDEISNYWNNADTGLNNISQLMAAQGGLREVSSTATLQSRDYLEQYARSWGEPIRLFSLDDPNGVVSLQENANPNSFPELSDDGKLLAYISDGDSSSIYDSRAHISNLSGDNYSQSTPFPSPSDGTSSFVGFGDSDVDIAGTSRYAVAAWVRMNTKIDEKDAGDDISAAEQNLLMNGTEIVASVCSNGKWTSTRLTDNATPDLAPVVATDGVSQAVVFWRSVYSSDPDNGLMDFSTQDRIMYSTLTSDGWSAPKMLYNGAAGSVKGLQAAMMSDGTAIAVYTLDRTGASDGSGQEIGYTIVKNDGSLGNSMLVTSDENLDENPQVVAASVHSFNGNAPGTHRFILGWHSLRSGVSDIQLLAVDANGAMSNNFPASLSALTSSGQANVGGDFRFARVWNSTTTGTGYATDLTILWSETVTDETTNGLMTAAHSQLKAARLVAEHTNENKIIDRFRLTAPQLVAELPDNTLLDHFDAYVKESLSTSNIHSLKAVIQATYYDQENQESIQDEETGATVTLPGEKVMLYTASQNFESYELEVGAIGVDYASLMANSLIPIQFTIRNTGSNNLENLTITLAKGETAVLSEAVRPNESATLTVYHQLGETVSNVEYTITDAGSNITKTGTVYLDYPDIGISQMKVLEEKEGQRTIAVTLYNASDAPLAGSGRTVKVAFYTDNLLTEAANVTYNGNSDSNIITLSSDDLARVDAGACTLVLTYNIKNYVENTIGKQEIPDSGVYLYADAWAEGTIGTQKETKRIPEVHSSDNQSAALLTGAYARTGEKTTLDVVQTNNDTTTATVVLRNNCLQPQSTATLVATLLDENNKVLEIKNTSISGALNGESEQSTVVQFSQLGSQVVVHAAADGEDSLTFDGLPVDMDDFVLTNEIYTYDIYGVTASDTLVTAISGSGETVTINGEAANSKCVSINKYGQTIISVEIGDTTYQLTIHNDAAPPVTEPETKPETKPTTEVTVIFDANGGNVTPSSATTKGGKLESLPTPTYDGYDFLGWYTEKDGGNKVTTDTVFTQDSTIYARWKNQADPEYTVTFDANGGSVTPTSATTKGWTLEKLPTPTYDGFDFLGWYTEKDDGNAVTTDTIFTKDSTIYARWKNQADPECTVTFDANGGSVTPTSTTTKGWKLETLPTPTYDGYNFLGWYTEKDAGDQVTTDTVFTKDSTIYAHWEKEGVASVGSQTDSSKTGLWFFLIPASLAVLFVILIVSRKRKNKGEETLP